MYENRKFCEIGLPDSLFGCPLIFDNDDSDTTVVV